MEKKGKRKEDKEIIWMFTRERKGEEEKRPFITNLFTYKEI